MTGGKNFRGTNCAAWCDASRKFLRPVIPHGTLTPASRSGFRRQLLISAAGENLLCYSNRDTTKSSPRFAEAGLTASLPMYDWPELRSATDALWAALARELGVSAPLLRGGDHTAAWRDPALLLSQTCGYPFTHRYRGTLAYVATPHYACDGCADAEYSSFIFARDTLPLEALRGACAAVNAPDSMSGMLALKLVFAPLARDGRFFGRAIETGGHIASMIAVRDGRADVCAIDAICVALARRDRPDLLEGLVEIARSPRVPGLPFVTGRKGDPARLRAALAKVFADPALAGVRAALFLEDLSNLPPAAYDRIPDLEGEMEQQGGLTLLED